MNNIQELCPKTMAIYHIKDKKVGSTSNLKQRLANQGGYTQMEWEVLHEIEPNAMTYRAIWELECQEQARLGYEVEHEGNYQTFLRSNTNNPQTGKPLTEAQKTAHSIAMSDGRMSGANNPMYGRMSGANNPMYGRTGEASHMYGRTGEASPMFGRTGEDCPMFGIKPANTKAYNIFNLDGDWFAYTDDPGGFEKENGLPRNALTDCANPNANRRYITISNTKYTVSYA